MGLIQITKEQNKYNDLFFNEFIKFIGKTEGVLSGMEVTEYEEGGKVFIDIDKGSFIRNGVIYLMEGKVKGNEAYSFHSLEITQFVDNLIVTNGYNNGSLVHSGFLRFYIVETQLSLYPEGEPRFEVKSELLPSDMMIAMRYIKNIGRLKTDSKLTGNDPLKYQLLIGDPSDPEFEEFFSVE